MRHPLFDKPRMNDSLQVDVVPEMTIKDFGRELVRLIWEEIGSIRHSRGTFWPADGYRSMLRVVYSNCSPKKSSPAERRWPVLASFVGPDKSFHVECTKDGLHLVLIPTLPLKDLLGLAEKIRSPFTIEPAGSC